MFTTAPWTRPQDRSGSRYPKHNHQVIKGDFTSVDDFDVLRSRNAEHQMDRNKWRNVEVDTPYVQPTIFVVLNYSVNLIKLYFSSDDNHDQISTSSSPSSSSNFHTDSPYDDDQDNSTQNQLDKVDAAVFGFGYGSSFGQNTHFGTAPDDSARRSWDNLNDRHEQGTNSKC